MLFAVQIRMQTVNNTSWQHQQGMCNDRLRSPILSVMVTACTRLLHQTEACHLPIFMQVPGALAEKVRSYYNYVVAREVQSEEAAIIAGLSSSLRMQVGVDSTVSY